MTTNAQSKQISANKTVHTTGYLRSVSWHLLEKAKENIEGSYLNCMASIVFSAFTLEAYLNYLGEMTIPFWDKIERKLSPNEKLELLAEELSIPIDYGSRPFQSFKPIFQFRNFLAHGKREYLEEVSIQILPEGEVPKLPDTKWQQANTIENTQKFSDDSQEIIEYLHNASGLDINPLMSPETATWSISEL